MHLRRHRRGGGEGGALGLGLQEIAVELRAQGLGQAHGPRQLGEDLDGGAWIGQRFGRVEHLLLERAGHAHAHLGQGLDTLGPPRRAFGDGVLQRHLDGCGGIHMEHIMNTNRQ